MRFCFNATQQSEKAYDYTFDAIEKRIITYSMLVLGWIGSWNWSASRNPWTCALRPYPSTGFRFRTHNPRHQLPIRRVCFHKMKITWMKKQCFFRYTRDIDVNRKLGAKDPTQPTVVEYLGHVWHGYPDSARNIGTNHQGKSYKAMYDKTMERLQVIKEKGYNVFYIWEEDFLEWKKHSVGKSLLACLFQMWHHYQWQ